MPDGFLEKLTEILERDGSKGKSFDELINQYNEETSEPVSHEDVLDFFVNSKPSVELLPDWFRMRLSEMRMSSGWED